jgi:hypothetical protein
MKPDAVQLMKRKANAQKNIATFALFALIMDVVWYIQTPDHPWQLQAIQGVLAGLLPLIIVNRTATYAALTVIAVVTEKQKRETFK